MRDQLKRSKNYISNNIGISTLFRYRNRNRAVVLTYHIVCDNETVSLTRPICSISREEFERHVEYFTCYYRIVPLSVIVECIRSGQPFPERCLAITFDDGFRNFYRFAYPTLRRRNLPVTVFLSTGLIGSAELFWFDKVEQLILNSKVQELSVCVKRKKLKIDLTNKPKAIQNLVEIIKPLSSQESEDVLKEVDRELGQLKDKAVGDDYLAMSWEEVRELAKNENVTFGTHTASHRIVTGLNDNELYSEIVGSKWTLEQELQRPVEHFSFPNGQPNDFDRRAKELLAKSGYRSASTTIEELNQQNTDCFELRRIGASLSLAELIPKISGLDSFLLRTVGRLPGIKQNSAQETIYERLG